LKVEIPDLTGAECGDIAITAAEGGIGYWSVIDTYQPSRWSHLFDDTKPGLTDGTNIEVEDDFVFYTLEWEGREPAEEKIDVTPTLIRNGLQRMIEAPLDEGGWAGAKLIGTDRSEWTGEIDSEMADMIIQFGSFSELVFG